MRRPFGCAPDVDIQMQQIARRGMFVAVGRQSRLQIADAAQLQPA